MSDDCTCTCDCVKCNVNENYILVRVREKPDAVSRDTIKVRNAIHTLSQEHGLDVADVPFIASHARTYLDSENRWAEVREIFKQRMNKAKASARATGKKCGALGCDCKGR